MAAVRTGFVVFDAAGVWSVGFPDAGDRKICHVGFVDIEVVWFLVFCVAVKVQGAAGRAGDQKSGHDGRGSDVFCEANAALDYCVDDVCVVNDRVVFQMVPEFLCFVLKDAALVLGDCERERGCQCERAERQFAAEVLHWFCPCWKKAATGGRCASLGMGE